MPPEISVILPAKNEARSVGAVVARVREILPACEVIVVNDGSSDDTAAVASQAGARTVNHVYCKGNGAAIKTGARAARGRILVFMDADGQHDPEDIPRLLQKIDEGYDLVVGARQDGSQASIGRGVANRVFSALASYMTGHNVQDLTSGFRAVRAQRFRSILYLLPNGFSYPTTSTMAFFRAGLSVGYLPIHAARRSGKSHISPLKDGMRFVIIIFKIGTLYSPLKLFLPFSMAFFAAGALNYLYTYLSAGRFTNMSALMFTTAALVFVIGLVSEQITQLMYKESGTTEE